MTQAATARITARAREIAGAETTLLLERTTASSAMYDRAVRSLPQGVGSSFQVGDPYPIYLSAGRGSRVVDVDGNEYVDFHNGFGCMLVGHAHPKVREAIAGAAATGTHFAAPTPGTVELAEVLCDRFGVDRVRFCNSGTEATMHAIRIARARDRARPHRQDRRLVPRAPRRGDVLRRCRTPICWADATCRPPHRCRSASRPPSPSTRMWSRSTTSTALERLLTDRPGEIACLILEPVMMNIGIAEPQPGYLQGLKDLLHKHGALLIFDEVKSGATVAYGGAADLYGVQPDLSCWAKATFGGTPGAAFGGRADIMDAIERGAAQQGTFNGNPLVAAAALATLTEVLTPDAYVELARVGTRLAEGCSKAIAEHGLPAHAVDLGAKGCVSYRPERLTCYRDFLETNVDLYAASFPWMVNRGVFMTPGDEEQWTLSVQHSDADIDRYVDAFAGFCAAVSG